MLRKSDPRSKPRPLEDWFLGKPAETRAIFDHFVREYKRIGKITIRSAKNMIVITTARKGIAYVVPGKNFVHVVFPFKQAYRDNLCFQKIAQGKVGAQQFNHHLRMFAKEDVNDEVRGFMRLAYKQGS